MDGMEYTFAFAAFSRIHSLPIGPPLRTAAVAGEFP